MLPLIELDRRLGWTERVAGLLEDPRQAAKTEHELPQLLRQRFFGLIAGYEDCNDHTRLRGDPILKAAAGKPLKKDLASQPTFSRFENAVTAREVAHINRWLPEQFVHVHGGRKIKQIILDIDPTDDPCHGHQQLALFNGFYGQYMYYPLLVYERQSGMLLGVRLQAGNAAAPKRAVSLLKPIIQRLRQQWPHVEIIVRGDAAFGGDVAAQGPNDRKALLHTYPTAGVRAELRRNVSKGPDRPNRNHTSGHSSAQCRLQAYPSATGRLPGPRLAVRCCIVNNAG